MKYQTPEKYYYRIHHVRPRFKNNVESVLLFMANAISTKGPLPTSDFKQFLIDEIYRFPGNQTSKLKTVQNWRTEISALFSLYYDEKGFSYPSPMAMDLNENQDLTKFLKYFLYTFQYPGGHIKSHEVSNLLSQKILFHPANYFLKVIVELQKIEKSQAFLTKGEACHMIFNDLRATRDFKYEKVKDVANRIVSNRNKKVEYDLTGDIIRYAGDILDYMTLANLLKNYAGKFFINSSESRAIKKYLSNNSYFIYASGRPDDIAKREGQWVRFATDHVSQKIFDTDIIAFIAKDEKEYKKLQERTSYIQSAEIPAEGARTKDIGDYGESLVYGHECMYLKINNRKDLIHWVQCIPNQMAVGYDIQSVDLEEIKKYIEVKSTISNKKLTFNRFKLTKNELSSAQTLGVNYYIYRLQIYKQDNEIPGVNLTIIQNPIQLFKENKIDIDLSSGEVNLKAYVGQDLKILYWTE